MGQKILKVVCAAILSLVCFSSIAQPPGGMGGPDFSEAAEKLGVTEEQLQEALGTTRPPDLPAAAEKLGVTEEQLVEALPAPPNGGRGER